MEKVKSDHSELMAKLDQERVQIEESHRQEVQRMRFEVLKYKELYLALEKNKTQNERII